MTYGVMPFALCALLLLALDSAFGNPHSALESANLFVDDPTLFMHLSRVKGRPLCLPLLIYLSLTLRPFYRIEGTTLT